MKKAAVLLLLGISLLGLVSCSSPPDPNITQEPTGTVPVQVATRLPHSLYYLSDLPDGIFQVWVIDPEGSSTQQITSEAAGVTEFDVSPADGRIAYVSENRLYLIDADGSGRTLLVDGGPVDEQSSAYHYTQKIAGISWAANGRMLAYGLNGIHLYFINEQSDFHVIQNVVEEGDSGTLFPVGLYLPFSWSPDDNYLLVEIDFFEGGTLGVYSMQSNDLVRLGGEGIVCCQPAWAPDSQSVLVASPLFGIAPSGLWRYDIHSGDGTELIHHTSEDDTLNFVNWPLQLPDGELRYFFNNMAAFPANDAPLLMVSAEYDGVDSRQLIRTEYWDNFEVLWAADGSLAVAIQPATGVQSSWPRTGPIVIIPASAAPPIPLPANGYSLHWGP